MQRKNMSGKTYYQDPFTYYDGSLPLHYKILSILQPTSVNELLNKLNKNNYILGLTFLQLFE